MDWAYIKNVARALISYAGSETVDTMSNDIVEARFALPVKELGRCPGSSMREVCRGNELLFLAHT